ncbi:hypothetical protein D3C78_883530 [compost metagenome]
MPAQIAQGVILDLHPIKEDLPLTVVIEARNQVGQGRLAAAGATNQRHHLPRFDAEADVVQYLLVGFRVDEAEMLHLETTSDAFALDSAHIGFRRLVELAEDAVGSRQALLDVGADFGQLADRFGQQAGGGDVGDQIAGGSVAAQVEHHVHEAGHARVDHQLQAGRVDGLGADHAQALGHVVATGLAEARLLVGFAAEAAHHAVALDGFRGDVGDIAHAFLDFLALLAELLAGHRHHQRDQRQDRQQHQGQLPVHPQQVAEQEDHRHAFADHHLDRIGDRAGNHGHVEGDARDQVAGVVTVVVAVGQVQQAVEQCAAQVMHHTTSHPGQEVVAEERTYALVDGNEYNRQRHAMHQLNAEQLGTVRVLQTVEEVLEHVRQHRLAGSE